MSDRPTAVPDTPRTNALAHALSTARGDGDRKDMITLARELERELAEARRGLSEAVAALERKATLLDETADKLEFYRKGAEAVPSLQQQLLHHAPGRRTDSEYERMGRPWGWTWLEDVRMWERVWERDVTLRSAYAEELRAAGEAAYAHWVDGYDVDGYDERDMFPTDHPMMVLRAKLDAALAKNPIPSGSNPSSASHSADTVSGPVGLGPDAIDLEADARHEAKMESYETALPSRPQDWRTVPHVPTRAMVDALVDCVMDSGDYERAFVLAINAAPKLPSQGRDAADHQQQRGRFADTLFEALTTYDSYMEQSMTEEHLTEADAPFQQPVPLLEELRIEAALVPHRRGALYGLAADRMEELHAALERAHARERSYAARLGEVVK